MCALDCVIMLINLNETLRLFELIPGKRNHLNTNINSIIARDYTRTLCCFVSRHWFCRAHMRSSKAPLSLSMTQVDNENDPGVRLNACRVYYANSDGIMCLRKSILFSTFFPAKTFFDEQS